MAGTVTFVEQKYSSVKKIRMTWTSNASGTASATTTANFDGSLIYLISRPSVLSGSIPTDNFDLAITDADGDDLIASAGDNLRNVSYQEWDEIYLGAVANSRITFTITTAGDTKSGIVSLWIR